jgi:hypothetical protein
MKYEIIQYNSVGSQNIGWTIQKIETGKVIEIENAFSRTIFNKLKSIGFFRKGVGINSVSFNNQGDTIKINTIKNYEPLGELKLI